MVKFSVNNLKFNVEKNKLIKYSGLFKKILSENSSDQFCFNIPCDMEEHGINGIDNALLFLFEMINSMPDNNDIINESESYEKMPKNSDYNMAIIECDEINKNNEFIMHGNSPKMTIHMCYFLYKLSQYFLVNKMQQYVMKFISDHYVNILLMRQQQNTKSGETLKNLAPCFAINPFYLITYKPMFGFGIDTNTNHSHILFKNIKLINKKVCYPLGPKNRSVFEYKKSENITAHYYLAQLCDSFEKNVGSKRPRGLIRHRHYVPFDGKFFFYEKDGLCVYDKENPDAVTVDAVNTPDHIFASLDQNTLYNIYFSVEAYMNTFEYGFTLTITQIDDIATTYILN